MNTKKYDKPVPKIIQIPVCEHKFHNSDEMIIEYSDKICDDIIKHGRDGFFIESFFGRYNVCLDAMTSWINDKENSTYDKLRSSIKISMSATLHYWNCELIHAIQHPDLSDNITVIRVILSDIMKNTPKGLRELLFDNLEKSESPEEKAMRLKHDKEKELQAAFRGHDSE